MCFFFLKLLYAVLHRYLGIKHGESFLACRLVIETDPCFGHLFSDLG